MAKNGALPKGVSRSVHRLCFPLLWKQPSTWQLTASMGGSACRPLLEVSKQLFEQFKTAWPGKDLQKEGGLMMNKLWLFSFLSKLKFYWSVYLAIRELSQRQFSAKLNTTKNVPKLKMKHNFCNRRLQWVWSNKNIALDYEPVSPYYSVKNIILLDYRIANSELVR